MVYNATKLRYKEKTYRNTSLNFMPHFRKVLDESREARFQIPFHQISGGFRRFILLGQQIGKQPYNVVRIGAQFQEFLHALVKLFIVEQVVGQQRLYLVNAFLLVVFTLIWDALRSNMYGKNLVLKQISLILRHVWPNYFHRRIGNYKKVTKKTHTFNISNAKPNLYKKNICQ